MEESIKNFSEQFRFSPEVENKNSLPEAVHFIVGGMGGSHLAADLLKGFDPAMDLSIHSDYGLHPEAHLPPERPGAKDRTLFIASSYSGNTEETVDFAQKALEHKYNVACIATGGELINLAKENNLPYILIPDTGIQPRTALGFSLIALATFVRPEIIHDLNPLAESLDPLSLREDGNEMAQILLNHLPVIYSSFNNRAVAYNWKIKLNETAKIPAFLNSFPELNHNEMTGFDVVSDTSSLSEKVRFIFLTDERDHPSIQKRMKVCESLFEKRGFEVIRRPLIGEDYFSRSIKSILTADWTALRLAELYGTEPEQVPMIEEFKKLIK